MATDGFDVKDMNVVLVGLGRSTVAASKLLRMKGAHPFITDSGQSAGLEIWMEQAQASQIPFVIEEDQASSFSRADLVIISPGVPWAADFLTHVRAAGITVMGELEFASTFCTAPILAVTGTNGKTTVTTLVQEMIQSAGHSAVLAGNNDTALSQVVLDKGDPEYIVLEVSSYQLESIDLFHPRVAALLNITEDHLERHGTMEHYAQTKARIFSNQTRRDVAIFNADDPWTAQLSTSVRAYPFYFSLTNRGDSTLYADDSFFYYEDKKIAPISANLLPGRHNLENVLAALAIVQAADLPMQDAVEGLRTFRGVEHRMEHVRNIGGVDYYNDSKSTNEQSLCVALKSFNNPIVLIAGGRGKGGDYSAVIPLIKGHVKSLILMGEDAVKMERAFQGLAPIHNAESMMDALRIAQKQAQPGDTVLLSPGCASFDKYRNFEERGREFKTCVYRLSDPSAS
ncbi:MAG: UDP-N-acetylmuramoyl-L-alanine--D-glutamate ligase [Candidatus Hydrogenedentales bacterium]|jgi:UDP-N-acetylmuramoylalanine--D-glutamate ligase